MVSYELGNFLASKEPSFLRISNLESEDSAATVTRGRR